jgi:hypothetical protein
MHILPKDVLKALARTYINFYVQSSMCESNMMLSEISKQFGKDSYGAM